MTCSTNCPTQDHGSYGECLRAKNLKTERSDRTAQTKADRNLDAYAKARSDGIQPKSTRPADVQRAIRISDKTGTAFRA